MGTEQFYWRCAEGHWIVMRSTKALAACSAALTVSGQADLLYNQPGQPPKELERVCGAKIIEGPLTDEERWPDG